MVSHRGQSGDGAQEMDRRRARTQGHADNRCRRGGGAAAGQEPVAGRCRRHRRRVCARRRGVIRGPDGAEIGRGLCAYDAEDAQKIRGRSSADIASISASAAEPKWSIATIWSSAANNARTRLSHKEEPPAACAAGVRRRVIEGEGLGGFARRCQYQRGGRRLVPRRAANFLPMAARIGPWLGWLCGRGGGTAARARCRHGKIGAEH